MDNIVSFAKYVTLILFGSVLLFCYYSLPDMMLSLEFDEAQLPLGGVSRNEFFYISIGFVTIVNIFFTLFVKFFENAPISRLSVPNQAFWMEDKTSRKSFFLVLQTWAYSFLVFVNLYSAFIVYRIYTVNNYYKATSSIMPDIIVFIVLIVAWFVFIAVRFRIKNYTLFGKRN